MNGIQVSQLLIAVHVLPTLYLYSLAGMRKSISFFPPRVILKLPRQGMKKENIATFNQTHSALHP